MRSDLTPTDKIHTLAHEVAHAKLHSAQSKDNWPTAIKETQAELSSYVISKNLGIDPGQQSIAYIDNWSKKLKALDVPQTGKILNQALQASTDVTQYLSSHLEKGEKKQVTTKKFLNPTNYLSSNRIFSQHSGIVKEKSMTQIKELYGYITAITKAPEVTILSFQEKTRLP
ncbi:hypothetical protein ACG92U_02935 [Leuconostoc citreum]